MELVRPVTLSTPAATLDAPLRPVAPVAAIGGPERQVLDPAVSVELSPDATKGDATKGAENPSRSGAASSATPTPRPSCSASRTRSTAT